MLFVCKDHVKEGLKVLAAPHVKKVQSSHKCGFIACNHSASYKLFCPTPFSRRIPHLVQIG